VISFKKEVDEIFGKIREKQEKIEKYRNKYRHREVQLQESIHAGRSRLSRAREAQYVLDIRNWQRLVLQLQDEVVDLAQMASDIGDLRERQFEEEVAKREIERHYSGGIRKTLVSSTSLPATSQRVFSGGRSCHGALGVDEKRTANQDDGGASDNPRPQERNKKRARLRRSTPSSLAGRTKPSVEPAIGDLDQDIVMDDNGKSRKESDGEERLYCYCQQHIDSSMVRCDGEECQYEWFHLHCLAFTEQPAK